MQAIVALCTGAYRLSKRTTQAVIEDLFGLPMSLGTMTNLEHATTQALAAPVAEAQTYVQTQPVAHLDETGWREGGTRASSNRFTSVGGSTQIAVSRLTRSAARARL